MRVSQSQRSVRVVAAPCRRSAAVAQLGNAGLELRVGAGVGVGPQTPGGPGVDQPAIVQPRPMLGGVSDITASQEDLLTLGEETQPLRGVHDEETRHTAGPEEDEYKQNESVHVSSCVAQTN